MITSSGVSAGIDATFAFIEQIWGQAKADELALDIEPVRVTDWRDDPFAEYWGCRTCHQSSKQAILLPVSHLLLLLQPLERELCQPLRKGAKLKGTRPVLDADPQI